MGYTGIAKISSEIKSMQPYLIPPLTRKQLFSIMLFSATIYGRRLVLLSEDCDLRLYRDSNPSLREIFIGGLAYADNHGLNRSLRTVCDFL